jgi:hypothetical protein
MKSFLTRVLLFLAMLCSFARATTLTGTVNNPDGSPFNGAIYLTLSQASTI